VLCWGKAPPTLPLEAKPGSAELVVALSPLGESDFWSDLIGPSDPRNRGRWTAPAFSLAGTGLRPPTRRQKAALGRRAKGYERSGRTARWGPQAREGVASLVMCMRRVLQRFRGRLLQADEQIKWQRVLRGGTKFQMFFHLPFAI
jgi:hypothetical protein